MQTNELITHPDDRATHVPALSPDDVPEPTASRILEETADLVLTVPTYGPPAILLVGPLVLFALMLAGPFLALLTIVAGMVVAAAIVALAVALLASPYLLVRHLRVRRATARRHPRARRLVPVDSRRAAA